MKTFYLTYFVLLYNDSIVTTAWLKLFMALISTCHTGSYVRMWTFKDDFRKDLMRILLLKPLGLSATGFQSF